MQRLASQFGHLKLFRAIAHPNARRLARSFRTVALAGGIGYAGYASGVHDALSDPEGITEKIMQRILAQSGSELLPARKSDSLLVSQLGNELIVAAQASLEAEEAALRTPPAGQNPDTERLEVVRRHRREFDRKWRFIVIDNDAINAFVTDQLPGVVFIHRGLIKAMKRDKDKLSFILAHELSHHLLDHGASARNLKAAISTLQLLTLVAVDPTGIVAFALELGAMSSLFSYTLELPYSRSHETEADALGLQLLVRACRNPREGIKAHEALARIEQQHGGAPDVTGIGASHPATLQRLADLQAELPKAEKEYKNAGCARRKEQVFRALGIS